MLSSAATAVNPNMSTMDLLFPVAPINCLASFAVSLGKGALDRTKLVNLLDPRCVYDQANKLRQRITAIGSSKALFTYDVTRDLVEYLFNHCSDPNNCNWREKISTWIEGSWSVVEGTGNGLRFIARGTGLMGPEERARFNQEGAEVDKFIKCPVPSDHVPTRSWAYFQARELMTAVIESLK